MPKKKRKRRKDHYSGIGGQAVIEGIMMRNGDKYSVAVRTPGNDIEVSVEAYDSFTPSEALTKIPFVRGVFNFIDSLILGIRTLNYSASFYEEPQTRRRERKKPLDRLLGDNSQKILTAITTIISIVLAVGLFMLIPYFLSRLFKRFIVSETLIALIEGVIRILILLLYIVGISCMNDIKRVFMYHGAEHKCINCIEKANPLTVENVMKQSRLHKRCGTSFLFFVAFVSVILFMFIRVNDPIMRVIIRILLIPVIASISYEIIRLAGRSNNIVIKILSAPGFWLQRLTTREPDPQMAEVAIAAVEAVFDWKEFLKKEFNFDVDNEDVLSNDILR